MAQTGHDIHRTPRFARVVAIVRCVFPGLVGTGVTSSPGGWIPNLTKQVAQYE